MTRSSGRDTLNEEGNAFARDYYEDDYFDDDHRAVGVGLPSLYHVADTWENFDRVCRMLDHRYERWRAKRNRP